MTSTPLDTPRQSSTSMALPEVQHASPYSTARKSRTPLPLPPRPCGSHAAPSSVAQPPPPRASGCSSLFLASSPVLCWAISIDVVHSALHYPRTLPALPACPSSGGASDQPRGAWPGEDTRQEWAKSYLRFQVSEGHFVQDAQSSPPVEHQTLAHPSTWLSGAGPPPDCNHTATCLHRYFYQRSCVTQTCQTPKRNNSGLPHARKPHSA